MTVVVRRQYTSTTIGQYDALIAAMGMVAGGPHIARGLLFHFAVETGDGFHVTDVWSSVEDFEEYAREHVTPAMLAIGVAPPIRIEVTEVHSFNTPRA